jgi:putative heme-binding domain-containing protein
MSTWLCRLCVSFVLAALASASTATAQADSDTKPQWIWHDDAGSDAVCRVRRVVDVREPVRKAYLRATADNAFSAWIDGARVLRGREWKRSFYADVTRRVAPGSLTLAIEARNEGGRAGLIAELVIEYASGQRLRVVTDDSFLVCAGSKDAGAAKEKKHSDDADADAAWRTDLAREPLGPARVLGALGMEPWGDPFAPRLATPAASLTLRAGYQATLVRSAAEWQGSWVSMTFAPDGTLYLGVERDGILRLRDPAAGEPEFLDLPPSITNVQGMTSAHGALWANVNLNDEGGGLFALRDGDGDGSFEDVQRVYQWKGDGEHGAHAVVPGPDGWLYVINGNMTDLPKGLAPTSPHRLFAEDVLLPPIEDPNGHAVGVKAPGCHVLRFKPGSLPDGGGIELFAAGMRNAYDIAFDCHGELYTFDSDMEWDLGLPWYRPVRVCHLTSGAEFGWRSGTGCWPAHFCDSLPPVVDIGRGSPTGVTFWYGNQVAAPDHGAFVAADWSLGRILLVRVATGSVETLISGKPLNVSDVAVGPDGALWFITGGRGTQSGLYRVAVSTPAASEPPAPLPSPAHAVRIALEKFHGRVMPEAVDVAWPLLEHDDAHVAHAARVALEHQPVAQWRARALQENEPARALAALLALARAGATERDAVVARILALWSELNTRDRELKALRVLAVACARHGAPSAALREALSARLAAWPATDDAVRAHERAALLVFLGAGEVVAPLLATLQTAATQSEQIAAAFLLSHVRTGWSPATLSTFGQWLAQARAQLGGGVSFDGYLDAIKTTFAERLTDPAHRALVEAWPKPPRVQPDVVAPGPFVRAWTLAELTPHLDAVAHGRSFRAGERAARAAQCITCHRFGDAGGSIGPDLTSVSSRFSRRDFLEAILDPSKVISEQYRLVMLTCKDGSTLAGRIVRESATELVLSLDPVAGTTQAVRVADIAARAPSPVSSMPPGLLNTLTREQVLDLLAYFENDGNKEAPAFQ